MSNEMEDAASIRDTGIRDTGITDSLVPARSRGLSFDSYGLLSAAFLVIQNY